MLAAAQRVRRRSEFTDAVRAGRRAGRGAVVVHLMVPADAAQPVDADAGLADADRRPTPTARAGFIVAKSVGHAVTRNTVRRRLRHLVRHRLPQLPPGATLIVRALPAAANCSSAELAADLDAALRAAARPGRSTSTGRRSTSARSRRRGTEASRETG
ncbi:ribonuclease P protein component [Solwaraspora sp. WMMD406]|uniref:ribonuclease P protein component n=1 Tax=Solwaraspora sp. WMMD406 TaxID=3016095 RepID=UPI002415BA39|nr:ribonuclease P protein component [Solwaraspora sp. WMMD406]MDG4763047.1 ribonuclease P protein component [Solwaraspora sp. WMMD406]